MKLAVIGKDVSRSTSPEIHKFIAANMGNCVDYVKISIPEEKFEEQIEKIIADLDGFNVTIPYKLSIIPHLKSVVGDAKIFGAVNTVTTVDRAGSNTDGLGFQMMLENNGVDVSDREVLVIGAGGAGRSVAKKLLDAGAKVAVYDKSYDNARRLEEEFGGIIALREIPLKPFHMVVNASGVGMHKTEGISPVGADLIDLCNIACDLIYTPKISRFLELAQAAGKKIINGEGMLFYQAYFSECIYFNIIPNREQAKWLFEKFSKEKNL